MVFFYNLLSKVMCNDSRNYKERGGQYLLRHSSFYIAVAFDSSGKGLQAYWIRYLFLDVTEKNKNAVNTLRTVR